MLLQWNFSLTQERRGMTQYLFPAKTMETDLKTAADKGRYQRDLVKHYLSLELLQMRWKTDSVRGFKKGAA